MKVKVYNQSAQELETAELPDAVFGLPWNADLVHQVITSYASNQRPKVAKVKDRSEVRGGGKKPWRQKGTGRARHGSIRSPIWKGGGVTHGPRAEENFKKKINKKMAKKALFTVLSSKARDNEIIVLDDLKLAESKTKLAAKIFTDFSKKDGFERITKGNGVLVALSEKNDTLRRALNNLPYVGVEEARNLNAYKAMGYKYLMFGKDAISVLKIKYQNDK